MHPYHSMESMDAFIVICVLGCVACQVKKIKEGVIYDGEFFSPLAAYLPGMLPKESEVAR